MYPQNIAQAQQGGALNAEKVKASPIRDAQTRLDNSIENLFKTITDLQQRLYPVLTPIPESPEKCGEPSSFPNQISTYLDVQSSIVTALDAKLRGVLERLELP